MNFETARGTSAPSFAIRHYRAWDATSWLRCRLLSFFHTNYYDDVVTVRPEYENQSVCLVAVIDDEVAGLIDIEIDGAESTIEVVAVHPAHERRGIGRALLSAAIAQLPDAVLTLDAWTREMEASNAWYRQNGFVENYQYLHVYKDWDENSAGFQSPPGLSAPTRAFMHAAIEDEAELRSRFRRVYVCRQYLKRLK